MSFIYSYYFARSYAEALPSQWEVSDVHRFEKMLKLETEFHGVPLQRNSKDQFLTALKEKSQLLLFLDANPQFAQLFRSKTDLLKTYPECNYDDFVMVQLADEVDRCLSADWANFITEKIAHDELFYMTFMMRYKALIPESVMRLMKNKIESILLRYLHEIQSDSNKLDWFLFQSYVQFTLLLKDQKLIQMVVEIEKIREQKLLEMLEILQEKDKKLSVNEILLILVVLFILFLLISRIP